MTAALVIVIVLVLLSVIALLWFLGDDRSSDVAAPFDEDAVDAVHIAAELADSGVGRPALTVGRPWCVWRERNTGVYLTSCGALELRSSDAICPLCGRRARIVDADGAA